MIITDDNIDGNIFFFAIFVSKSNWNRRHTSFFSSLFLFRFYLFFLFRVLLNLSRNTVCIFFFVRMMDGYEGIQSLLRYVCKFLLLFIKK